MSTSLKILGQLAPSAASNSDMYTVPASTESVCSTLTVCNRGAAATFRVAIREGGATLANLHYLYFDTSIPANSTLTATIGLTLSATDVVTVYASSGSLSFGLYGSEIA